ncbi:jg12976 [Pararge aegeria aegeria]|uniref:Jg12976 protein n=1 Tax=Pararge aegeria aegeria TaxID=348720 RepID=A0A8S4RVB6_9NEOP|nr:jg12976 [Pararge aegeria aegeria]
MPQGALGWKAKVGTWIFKCGSSLISEKFALTAAHCSCVASTDKTVTDLEPKIVRLGCSNIMDVDRGEPAYDVNIRRFISHHRYNPPRQYYDIALVELEQEVSFRWQVHPACLWTKFKNPVGGTVTGWGVVETASLTTSPELQKADIRIVEADHCDDMLQMKRNGRKWWGIVWHQLCAGDSAGRIDTCRGDSGGPLQTLIPLRHSSPFLRWKLHQIVGVTSFGFGCAPAPRARYNLRTAGRQAGKQAGRQAVLLKAGRQPARQTARQKARVTARQIARHKARLKARQPARQPARQTARQTARQPARQTARQKQGNLPKYPVYNISIADIDPGVYNMHVIYQSRGFDSHNWKMFV